MTDFRSSSSTPDQTPLAGVEPVTRVANPLEKPGDQRLLTQFLQHFSRHAGFGGVTPEAMVQQLQCQERPSVELLEQITTAFSALPYENLTKILKQDTTNDIAAARRNPAEVLDDHVRFRTGGTCFSLTATLLHLVRSLGFDAEPILADRRYGTDTHCALLVWIDQQPHLIDPGYLIVRPVPLDAAQTTSITTSFNEIVLKPETNGDRLALHTRSGNSSTYRLTFKTSPVDDGQFLKAWDDSFGWDMMNYPVLTAVRHGQQLYLQGDHFQVRTAGSVHRQEISSDEILRRIVHEFGLDAAIAQRALAVLAKGS
jgi:arylamine N-acetyltransferase